MDLSSMLNHDDSKPAGSRSAARVNDRLATIAPSFPISLDTKPRNEAQDDPYIHRKRQRVEDELPAPQVAAVPVPSKPPQLAPVQSAARDAPVSAGAAVSPQQGSASLPATVSPTSNSRNNSIVAVTDRPDKFEPSIVNIQPSEELTRLISDFIFLNLNDEGIENLEVHSCF
jgi:hypothetical protein